MNPRAVQTAGLVHAMHSAGIATRPRIVPRPVYPMRAEEQYGSALAGLVHRMLAAIAELRAAMPHLLARAELDYARHDAGELEIARRLIEEAKAKMGRTISQTDVLALARLAGERTSIAQRADLQKQLRAGLGIDVQLNEQRTREMIINFAGQNAQLISTIPSGLLDQVAALNVRAFQKRMTPETYAEELQKIADVTENKARALARDQIGTLTGQLAQARHRELGITGYYWVSRRDGRVRDAHIVLDMRSQRGEVFQYDNPPKEGNPGDAWGCRCMAKPDLKPVLDAIAAQQAHARPVP